MDSLEEQLYLAVVRGDTEVVRGLLRQGANVNVVCESGRTPLGTAAQLGNTAILQVLLDASDVFPPGGGKLQEHNHDHRPQRRRRGDSRRPRSDQEHIRGEKNVCVRDDSYHDLARLDLNNVDSVENTNQNRSDDASEYFCGATDDLEGQRDVHLSLNIPVRSAINNISDEEVAKPEKNLGYFIFVHKEMNIDEQSANENIMSDENRNISQDDDQLSLPPNNHEVFNMSPSESEDVLSPISNQHNFHMDDMKTPDGMDKLEWDLEVDEAEESEEKVECDDAWTSLYKWYADILERTSELLNLPPRCDVNHQDAYGRCAVHYAAEQGHIEALKLLIAAGCRVDNGDSDSVTPLHLAASRDHTEVVKLLLEAGAKVNRKTTDKTSALHIAASRGLIDTVKVLLEAGAKVDSLDAADRTPLMVAVSRGHEDVVELLIQHGAKTNIEEIHGYTPLCEAVWEKKVSLVQMLLNAGAKLTQSHHLLHYAILHRHVPMAELLLDAGSIVNLRDDNGDPPLIVAARTGQFHLAELLLRNGAIVSYPNGLTGSTPLHEAVEGIRDSDYQTFEAMFTVLRTFGARLDVETFTPGDTPLFRAILLEKNRAAALLIRHGSNVNLGNVYSCNVDNLCLARKRNNFFLAKLLVFAGFNLKNTPWLEILPSDIGHSYSVDTLKGWLIYMKQNPMGLADLCRICVRQRLGSKVYEKILQSRLPERLKRYLLLEDIQEDDH